MWVAAGDIILISLREYQDDKADVIVKFTADEARALKAAREIPESVTINDAAVDGPGGDDGEGGFEFVGADASGSDSDSDSEAGAGGEIDVDAI